MTVVFNNPFDSFHNTVAQAKEERERLDRLLTVSTPRERLLVGAIAVLLLILAAWLVFGNVARTLAVDGVLVGPGDISPGGDPSLRALVWAEGHVVPRVRVGMPVAIELAMADADTKWLAGAVAGVHAVPPSGELGPFESVAPLSAYRLDIAFDGGLDLPALAGRECRIVIELGRQSPVAFLGMTGP